ncbi:MAG: DsbA family protein [Candidatus Uhrbacteria bacterium]|nr:DsbA family protein [Candidatus Uhrbacteria bacterium]
MSKVSSLGKALLGYAVPVVIVIGLIAMFAWLGSKQSDPTPGNLAAEITSNEWMHGPLDGKLTIVEYSDFQCPTCAAFHPITERLVDDYGDQITFVYRQFPLQELHRNALLASAASEAAGLQGKFWEMYDKLFDNQTAWSSSSDALSIFTTYAQDVGIDTEQFLVDIESSAVRDAITSDYDSGIASGVAGTPTFYINGVQLQELPRGYEAFKAVVDAKLTELGMIAITEPATEIPDTSSEETSE